MQQVEKSEPLADVEQAHAFRRVELVPGHREQMHAQRIHQGRDLAHRLRRVGVEQGAVFVRNVGQGRDGLNRADLVVGLHNRHEHGVRRHRASQVVRVHLPEPVNGHLPRPPRTVGPTRTGAHTPARPAACRSVLGWNGLQFLYVSSQSEP